MYMEHVNEQSANVQLDRRGIHRGAHGFKRPESHWDPETPEKTMVSLSTHELQKTATFRLQMSPTPLSVVLTAGVAIASPSSRDETTPSSPPSSFKPRSLARWRRQMKQKLVLISSILSLTYTDRRPETTSLNCRASEGSVAFSSLASSSSWRKLS
jgi:hypothetical protein